MADAIGMENEMTQEDVLDLRDDKSLSDARWNRLLSSEEVAMIREYRSSGRKGVAVLEYAGHLSEEQLQKLVGLTKEAMGVAKVLVLPDGVKISRI